MPIKVAPSPTVSAGLRCHASDQSRHPRAEAPDPSRGSARVRPRQGLLRERMTGWVDGPERRCTLPFELWPAPNRGEGSELAEEFAGDGVDDPDVQVLDEQDDVGSAVGSADADVTELSGHAQGDRACWHEYTRCTPKVIDPANVSGCMAWLIRTVHSGDGNGLRHPTPYLVATWWSRRPPDE